MKIAGRLLAAVLIAAAAVWLWTIFFPNPDRVIRKRLAETARAASFAPGQSVFSRLAGAQRLANFFATNVQVNIDIPGHQQRQWSGRDDLLQAALGARSSIESLKVTFPDISLSIDPDKESATADLTAEARISGDSYLYVEEMKFMFRKFGGEWLITQVQTVQTLQSPAQP
jgi:hypothetical protein